METIFLLRTKLRKEIESFVSKTWQGRGELESSAKDLRKAFFPVDAVDDDDLYLYHWLECWWFLLNK